MGVVLESFLSLLSCLFRFSSLPRPQSPSLLLSNTPQPIWTHHRQVPGASQECRAPSTIVAPEGSWGGFALHPARQSWQLRACGALRLQRPRAQCPTPLITRHRLRCPSDNGREQ